MIRDYGLKDIEQHIVHAYLAENAIDFSESKLLTNFFSGFEQIPELYSATHSLKIQSIKELENYLELLIPVDDRKFNGAFFTPDFIVDFIVNEIKPAENEINLDLSCGCGAFLVGLAQYYKKTFNKPLRNIVKENLYGSDILDYNIRRTKLILSILGLTYGEVLVEEDFNLFCQDSLRVKWEIQFDNILGNPPYVKFQDLTEENRSYLSSQWSTISNGTYNLYFAFFELGYKLLKPNGKLGYITPNNYFTSLAGESLRKFFHSQKCVARIVDFNHKKVFDAQTYTAITFLSKQENESLTFDRIKEKQNPEAFLAKANGSPVYLNDLNEKKWRLLKEDEQKNIGIIERIGTPIGKLFDICVGIATLKDDIFFVDSAHSKDSFYLKETENGVFEIEKEITTPVHKVSEFKSQDSIKENTRRIICPYTISNGVALPISEKEFKEKYPKCYTYFLSEKENLLARDKGKVTFSPFFVWGRTQGLTRRGKKILTPTFSQKPRFLIVEEEDSYYTNGYGLFFKDKAFANDETKSIAKIENIDAVQKILNSHIMHYYVKTTSVSIEGGYPCYQKNFIEKFTIPEFTDEEITIIKSLSYAEEIDAFLIEKYQLKLSLGNLVL